MVNLTMYNFLLLTCAQATAEKKEIQRYRKNNLKKDANKNTQYETFIVYLIFYTPVYLYFLFLHKF